MATLVLTAVGSVIGGPLGGAIGAALGQTIDRAVLLKPKGRQGPRLAELSVQTSSYGRQIPKVFGTMRVAGSVIWATDLVEHRRKQSGGKGQPSVTSYSYSASFAVALSARPVTRIGRVWAEGTLLRGAAGDWKVATGFRLHPGGEGQAPDPLIASAEGTGLAPAHRGIAYAVFEGLPLEEFGNRIPSLTFEVVCDEDPVTIGAIAREIGAGAIGGDGPTLMADGFSAYGDSARAAIETLGDATGAWFAPRDGVIEMRTTAGVSAAIVADASPGAGAAQTRAPIDIVPRIVTVSHYEPARDWQAGVQRATRPGAGRRELAIEAPIALSAAAAKTIAEGALIRAETQRTTRRVQTDLTAIGVAPGDAVMIAGEPGRWRVTQTSIERLAVTLDLVPLAPMPIALPASGGRVLGTPDRATGSTILHAFETPVLDDVLLSVPRLTIVAAGSAAGWRRAALLYSLDGGVSWGEAGGTAAPGVVGMVVSAAGPAATTIEDRRGAIEIELAHDAMTLADATPDAIERGANLALVGDELLQFRHATPLSATRWRLDRLLRGRRGSSVGHVAGARFVLLDETCAVTMPVAVGPGASVQIMASGAGDATPATATATISGTSVLPPAPVRLVAESDAGGGATLRWRRRSRTGWRWSDGADAPLGEEREAYRVILSAGGAVIRTTECDTPTLVVTAAERGGGSVTASVRQIGTNGLSPAASIDF